MAIEWTEHPQGMAGGAAPLAHVAATDVGPHPDWAVPPWSWAASVPRISRDRPRKMRSAAARKIGPIMEAEGCANNLANRRTAAHARPRSLGWANYRPAPVAAVGNAQGSGGSWSL